MYSKSENRVNYFLDTDGKHTDKVYYGRVSEPIKTGEKTDEGKDKYEYETWNARFVGKARSKIESIADKTRITLTEWSARNNYNKEAKKNYPYLMIMDFNLTDAESK